eukprot:GFKZ01002161.1.p2 GENE.GFKZ01002161.1~~GFKZ01002161.1.p2  ORF type:complete len:115 (-),score=16.88 GFKZ01002161.1:189-533(-)
MQHCDRNSAAAERLQHGIIVRGGFVGGFSRWREGMLRKDIGGTKAAAVDEGRVFQLETWTFLPDWSPHNRVAERVAAVSDPKLVFSGKGVVAAQVSWLLAIGAKPSRSVVVVQS